MLVGTFCIAALLGGGCSADASGSQSGSPSGSGVTPGGAAGFGAGGVSQLGPSAATTGGGMFGNSTAQPTMVVGMPGSGEKCKEPMIVFVVDGSGSMCETFGNATRWTAVRTALVDKTNGLIYKLQDRGDFGLLVYDGGIDFMVAQMATSTSPNPMCAGGATFQRAMMMGGMCEQMIEVTPGRGKAAAIDMKFPQRELGGSTPTDKVMNHEVDQMIAARDPNADPTLHPQFIVLATDGQPNDICTGGMGGDGTAQQMNVIAAVDRAAQAGITTFVISLAGSDMGLEMHLATVAQHGDPTNPMAHTFSPTNPQDLVTALTTLLGSAFGCHIS
jgi:hypothetical protein